MAGIQLLVDNIYKYFDHTLLTSTEYVRNKEKKVEKELQNWIGKI